MVGPNAYVVKELPDDLAVRILDPAQQDLPRRTDACLQQALEEAEAGGPTAPPTPHALLSAVPILADFRRCPALNQALDWTDADGRTRACRQASRLLFGS